MGYFVWIIVFVSVCIFSDFRERKIYLWWCAVNALGGICVNVVLRGHTFWDMVSGAAIGCLLVLTGILTKEKIGIGDGVVILTIGLIAGGVTGFSIMIWSFAVCSLFSVAAVAMSKMKWDHSVPFTPYILIGSIITLCLQKL